MLSKNKHPNLHIRKAGKERMQEGLHTHRGAAREREAAVPAGLAPRTGGRHALTSEP